MLRDIPKIYFMFFAFAVATVLFTFWYGKAFNRGSDTLQLNDAILASSVSEVDQTSRLYEGVLILSDTFESAVWEKIKDQYPEGSGVQFDYVFDADDDRFDNVEADTVSSPTYRIGGTDPGDEPSPEHASYMTGRPIEAVRVKVHQKGDKASDWTYTSTVTVDAASKAGR